jgi:hypothetical protein
MVPLVSELDRLGLRYDSDRSSLYRDLLRRYEPFLTAFRDDPFDLLQVGVGDGASLRIWADYFPNARLIGLEARRLAVRDLPERCSLVLGRQSDLGVLQQLIRDYRFQVVVDAGAGSPRDQVSAFAALFPALQPGGVYICEGPDFAFFAFSNLAKEAELPSEPDMRELVCTLICPRNSDRPDQTLVDHERLLHIGRHVDSLTVLDGALMFVHTGGKSHG